jgi:rhamnulokinase
MATKIHNFIAVDLGASNGRITHGRLEGSKFGLSLIHRFEHAPHLIENRMCWDWNFIVDNVRCGLRKAGEVLGNDTITSISCDAWAQDFGLIGENGRLVYAPVSYRDSRTDGMPHAFKDIISSRDLIQRTGSIISPITSLCQLRAMAVNEPHILKQAKSLLFIADLVHHELCGQSATDQTLASASQMCSITSGDWDHHLLKSLDIPVAILPTIIKMPCVLGTIPGERAPHPKFVGVPIVVSAGHDTAVAAAASLIAQDGTLFLSLGTWAMLGCCSDEPFVPATTDESFALLGLPYGTWGLFQGAPGLWMMQECQRIWKQMGCTINYDELVSEAQASSIKSVINLSDKRFISPPNMLSEIAGACRELGQQEPVTKGEVAAVVFNSLAHNLKSCAERLATITGRQFRKVHIVGGGSRNIYLCRRLREVLGMPVIGGPSEATTIGNLLLQVGAAGAASRPEQKQEILDNILSSQSFRI